MHSYDLLENNTGKVLGRVKLKTTVQEYAQGAISCLSDQLLTVKSRNRKAKLEHRLAEWKKLLASIEAEHQKNIQLAEDLKLDQKKEMIIDVESIQPQIEVPNTNE